MILVFGSGTLEECIVFVVLVWKKLNGQRITSSPPIYEGMERVLMNDAKTELQARTKEIRTSSKDNFNDIMRALSAHMFPTFAYCDQKRYMTRYLRKFYNWKVRIFTTSLIQLIDYLTYFTEDFQGQ